MLAVVRILACVMALLVVLVPSSIPERVVVGYFTDWAQYRSGCQLETTGFTHVVLAFGKINATYDVIQADSWGDPAVYQELRDQKAANPLLKTLISFGGYSFSQIAPECYIFPELARNEAVRAPFTQKLIQFVRQHGFDGVDIDWEYPGACASSNADAIQQEHDYVTFVAYLESAFQIEAHDSGNPRLLLTAALPVPASHPNMQYRNLSLHLDWMNMMTYDMAGVWEGVTGAHTALAPCYPGHKTNVMAVVDDLLSYGVAANKIVIGIAYYGHSYALTSSSNATFGAPISGYGVGGSCTNQAGFMAWFEMQQFIAQGTTVYHDITHTVFTYKDNTWVGYDNANTIKMKGEYILSKNLRGAMVWSTDYDDENRTLSRALVQSLSGDDGTSAAASMISNVSIVLCFIMSLLWSL